LPNVLTIGGNWRLKDWMIALTFALSVPNLGLLQAEPQREARGRLVKLPPVSEAHESPAIELNGP
jgi:hypothetical protein